MSVCTEETVSVSAFSQFKFNCVTLYCVTFDIHRVPVPLVSMLVLRFDNCVILMRDENVCYALTGLCYLMLLMTSR